MAIPISYACHRFPAEAIQHDVWLHLGSTLVCRDGEDMLADRGLGISYEAVRRWVGTFGRAYAPGLRRSHIPVQRCACVQRDNAGHTIYG